LRSLEPWLSLSSLGRKFIQIVDRAIPEEKMVAIKEAIFRGQKIAAIKLYREAMGLGLTEAKAAVDQLETELRSSAPYEFKAAESRGCLAWL
jgi:ribosomal protein L7/L12